MSNAQGSYTSRFYVDGMTDAVRGSERVLPYVFRMLSPESIVDVGCGSGAWAKSAGELGGRDVLGIDGPWVDSELLQIPSAHFMRLDLEQPLDVGRSFDLAISLEVAEHLRESAAETFVKSLTTLAPVVLFSAAIPNQGGVHHINEQWPEYWSRLFGQCEYRPIDCLRTVFWSDPRVPPYYAQNMLLYVDSSLHEQYARYATLPLAPDGSPLPLVHPYVFEKRTDIESLGMKGIARLLPGMIQRRLKRWTRLNAGVERSTTDG